MTLTLGQTATFVKLWKQWRLNDDDLRALERQMLDNPLSGKVMRNTGGVRKVRFVPPSQHAGKSGAFRVCYVYFPAAQAAFFLLLFSKNEQPNLTAEQERMCKQIVADIRRSMRFT